MTRHASELSKHPLFNVGRNAEAPVSRGIDNLTTEQGDRLQLMARINSPEMVRAVAIANIYVNIYGSKYVKGIIDEKLRLSVATNGQGRREIIDVVDAGGNLPAEYYTGNKPKFSPAGEEGN